MTRALSVTLPSEVVYVSGTVNGTEYTWTLTGRAWTATVERSPTDAYAVDITAVTVSGISTNYVLTLYYGLLSLITDRTQADVNRVVSFAKRGWSGLTEAEKTEWLAGMKGAYNATDLNRVGGAVNYLAARLTQLPEDVAAYLAEKGVAPDTLFVVPYAPEDYEIVAKTSWLISDIPTAAEMAEYLGNVVLLRGAMDYDTDELPATMSKLDYTGANAIEKALLNLDAAISAWKVKDEIFIDNTAAARFYCGDLVAGEI